MAKMKLPNGFGSIVKLTGKRRNPYMVRKTTRIDKETGMQMMDIIGYYHTYSEALTALVEYNNHGTIPNIPVPTFKSLYEAYTDAKYTKYDKSIPVVYSSAYKRCKSLYDVSVKDIKLQMLQNIIDDAPSFSTQRQLKTLLNQVMEYAIKYEHLDKNIVPHLTLMDAAKSEIHQPLTLDEIKAIWSHKDELMAKILLVYIYTGMRPQELPLVEKSDVHLDEQYLIGGIKTEAGTDRAIPIADCILPIIKELMDNPTGHMVAYRGRAFVYGTLRQKIYKYFEKLHMEHLPHDTRHTTATLLDAADVNILTTQKMLGHKSSAGGITGRVYIHKDIRQMLDAVNLLPHW